MVGNDIRNRFARFERRTANPAAPCAVDRRKRQAGRQAGRPVRAFAAGAVWPRRFGDGRRRGFASVSAPTGRQGRRMASLFTADARVACAMLSNWRAQARFVASFVGPEPARNGKASSMLPPRNQGNAPTGFPKERENPPPETPLAGCAAAHRGISREPFHAATQPRQRYASERAAEIDSADRDGWTQESRSERRNAEKRRRFARMRRPGYPARRKHSSERRRGRGANAVSRGRTAQSARPSRPPLPCADEGESRRPRRRRVVGAAGIEPATPTMST